MDLNVIKSFLSDKLPTRTSVEDAAAAAGISVATLYRYKANPEGMALGTLARLSEHLGLPLENGAAWGRPDLIRSEERRYELEKAIAASGGARLTTVSPYSVNVELAEVTRILLQLDYGSRANRIEQEILKTRGMRIALYETEAYDSWEIWNGLGYSDFYHGRGRFRAIPPGVRKAQIQRFIDSSMSERRHRFVYGTACPELPMFGCYSPPGVSLVRVDDIHLEFQAPDLVRNFEETFDEVRNRCATKTRDEFVAFLQNPEV